MSCNTCRLLPEAEFKQAQRLVITGGVASGCLVAAYTIAHMLTSPTFGWSGRSLTLLDPTYASKYIPIVASVSEHQPPAWNAYFTDIHMMVMLMPIGFVLCFRPLTDATLFLVLYGVTAVYFSGVMVRLMLVLAPAACCLSAIAASEMFSRLSASVIANLRGSSVVVYDTPALINRGGPSTGAAAAASKTTSRCAGKSSMSYLRIRPNKCVVVLSNSSKLLTICDLRVYMFPQQLCDLFYLMVQAKRNNRPRKEGWKGGQGVSNLSCEGIERDEEGAVAAADGCVYRGHRATVCDDRVLHRALCVGKR